MRLVSLKKLSLGKHLTELRPTFRTVTQDFLKIFQGNECFLDYTKYKGYIYFYLMSNILLLLLAMWVYFINLFSLVKVSVLPTGKYKIYNRETVALSGAPFLIRGGNEFD